jgi:hypothetical protein
MKNKIMNIFISTIVMLWALTGSAAAHELQANRATLVLRDRQHLSLTFFVDYARVLHQVLAPQQSFQDFALMYSAMKPAEFQAQLQGAQRKLQSSTAITLHSGKAAVLTQWVWPGATAAQNLLQQRAMQAVVAPTDHAHVVPTEIRAEAKSGSVSDFTSITLQLPTEFQQVLVVSYQPKQIWVKPGALSSTINF